MSLEDLLDVPAMQSLMDDFFKVANVGIGLIDTRGNILVSTGWQEICSKYHRAQPAACARCVESQTLSAQGVAPGEFRLYRCRNNLWEVTTPVVVGGAHLGNIFVGQFLFEGEHVDYEVFRQQAREFGFDQRHYLAALDRVPRWSRETVDTVLSFCLKLALLVANLGFGAQELEQAVAQRDALLAQLRDGEQRFRSLVESSPMGMHLYHLEADDRLLLTGANPSADRILGIAHAPLLGKTIEEAFPNLAGTEIPELYRRVARGALAPYAFQTPYRDGQVSGVYDVSVFPTGPGMMAVDFVDITSRKREEAEREYLKEQLRASQKMEAVGRLAGGVAHDFNNLLTVILNCARFALEGVRADDPIREDLSEIEKAADRAATLTRQLLAFSRKQLLQPRVVDLNQIVLGIDGMLRRILGEDIELVRVLARELGLTRADPGQIEQVIMNLAINARDAMPDGGTLTLQTQDVDVEVGATTRLGGAGPTPGAHVVLTVRDSGIGMDAETQARLFEPFFTTKEKGRGTGLGLSTVYGIVKQSGGEIVVESAPGEGTTFRVYLPRDRTATEAEANPRGPRESAPGAESILLVEDEDGVRALIQRVLAESGYRVLTCTNSAQAVECFAAHAAEIQLLLTDVVMPGASGRALAEQLTQLKPGLPVLFMSGYTQDVIGQHGVLDRATHFIGKPFTAAEITQKVRAVLGHRQP
jgi:two-component system cell cycle sensor histidine kinase/response regulator CckA